MNQDTGEIRQMTDEERKRLNDLAGRELWVPVEPPAPQPSNGLSRKERRQNERADRKRQGRKVPQ